MTAPEAPLTRSETMWTIIPVWILAAVGTLLVGLLADTDRRFGWLSLTLAASMMLSFLIQLAVSRREGFVSRVTAGIVGAVIVTAIGSVVIALSAL